MRPGLGTRDSPHLLVWLEDIRNWSGSNDAKWIEHEMARHIVLLNMLELGGLFECRHIPVEIPEPAMDGRVAASNVSNVALEVLDVYRVETDHGHVQANVGFGKVLAEIIWSFGSRGLELRLGFVEMGEEIGHCSFICFLSAGESALARKWLGQAQM